MNLTYWFYSYSHNRGHGSGTFTAESDFFDVKEAIELAEESGVEGVVILNFFQISYAQAAKMNAGYDALKESRCIHSVKKPSFPQERKPDA